MATAVALSFVPPLRGQAAPLTAHETAKARAFLDEQLPCLGCHALGGSGGRVGPALDGVGGRMGEGAILAMIRDPQRERPGSLMPRTPMTAGTAALLARYLAAQGASLDVARDRAPRRHDTVRAGAARNQSAAARTTSAPSDGPALYARHCAVCHGAAGDGDGPNARWLPVRPARHASAAEMSRRSDDALHDAIAAGGRVMGRSARMPAFGETLAPAEIRALVGHLRALCRCEQPAWARR